jgi:hypothetical protein
VAGGAFRELFDEDLLLAVPVAEGLVSAVIASASLGSNVMCMLARWPVSPPQVRPDLINIPRSAMSTSHQYDAALGGARRPRASSRRLTGENGPGRGSSLERGRTRGARIRHSRSVRK